MNEQLTTYRVKGKAIGLIMLFKYHLNGDFRALEIPETALDEKQQKWLFDFSHFPSNEAKMKYWIKEKSFKDKFDIEVAPADLSFDALWKLYDLKIARYHAEKAFGKLKEETKIKLFVSIPIYKKYLAKSGIAQAHLATYINGQYYDNEY